MLTSNLSLAALLVLAASSSAAAASSEPSIDSRSVQPQQQQSSSLNTRNTIPPEWHVRRAHHPQPRSYESHHYYAIELHSWEKLAKRASGLYSDEQGQEMDPRAVAELLGAELVERVGELKDHWLIRIPKRAIVHDRIAAAAGALSERGEAKQYRDFAMEEDPVLRRWEEIVQARSSPSDTPSGKFSKREHLLASLSLKSIERQEPRQRAKRAQISSPWDNAASSQHKRNKQDFEQLPWRPHIPAPRGASPDPRDDPDFLQFYNDTNSQLLQARQRRAPPTIPDPPSLQIASQFDIHDPIFAEQWHLANDKKIGYDLNVSGVWKQGIFGAGVNVALIDDGLDMHTDDLKENFFPEGSYDFNNHVPLPEPRLSDDQHGTRCAGEIAAVKNDQCGVGVAYKAHVAGLRILSGPISDVDEAAALNFRMQDNHIYSCSWGPPDDGRSMDAPRGLIAKAFLNGIQNGRDGKGSIFVFAGGNGGASDDQCNFDGYTNSIYSMTIAAVDREGLHPYYSEMCSANLATAWSSGSGDHIHTTDVTRNGEQRCTSSHGGTSAAAPLVAGVAALALEARPELTWRDMQHVAVKSAQMVNPQDKDWQKTQAGRHYNHKFGYGVIDAYKFIEEAKNHKLVKPQAWLESGPILIENSNTLIVEGGVTSSFKVTKDMLRERNFETLEHVTVNVWITHDRRGDLQIELNSPHGTKSVLARPRRYDEASTGFPGWGFMSVKHWDEDPVGDWTLSVFDRSHPQQTGNFYNWSMTLWGASIDPSKATLWTFPEDSKEAHVTLPEEPGTGAYPTPATTQHAKPTQHLPGDHGVAPGESEQDFTHAKVEDPTTNNQGSSNTPAAAAKPEADTGYLSGLGKNSSWVFVAAGVVFVFAASVAAFFILRRRRRAGAGGKGDTAGYEFVPDDEDMEMGARGSVPGAKSGRGVGLRGTGGAARTKELYDAFGDGPSDDEDDEYESKAQGSAGRRYQDRLLGGSVYHDDDDDEEGDSRFAIGDGPASAVTPRSAEGYRDDPAPSSSSSSTSANNNAAATAPVSGNDDEKRREEENSLFDLGDDGEDEDDGEGSGESWQDAGKA